MEMIGGLAGAAGSIVSGILGAKAADRAANMNWAMNLMNYYQREDERRQAMRRADAASAEQKLGGSDIRGTRTQWVPGKGWVVTAAPQVKKMMDLQDAAQMDILTKDIPMRRKVQERNYVRGLADEEQADTYRRQMDNLYRGTDQEYEADLYKAMTAGLAEASRDNSRKIFTQAMRTRQNSNFGQIARQLARAENEAYSRAGLNAKLQSKGKANAEYSAERNNLAQLYNMFASRAGQLPDAQYRPMNMGEGDGADMSKQALQASLEAAKIAGMKGGTLDYVQPNYGWANAAGGAGAALGSLGRLAGASSRRGGGSLGGGGSSGVTGFGSTSGEGDFTFNSGINWDAVEQQYGGGWGGEGSWGSGAP